MTSNVVMGPLCVVCGRSDREGTFRKSGFKCHACRGEKSSERLRDMSLDRGPRRASTGRIRSQSPLYSSPGHRYPREDVVYLRSRIVELEEENHRLRQREAWITEARQAHLNRSYCQWCEKYANGAHTHPCLFSDIPASSSPYHR
eukprot:TRINITY_DN4867_c0_g1_i1.p1 TRINITY_DN4867_c0_g1~~TRINITY_DN4867_c0_g1_i1.p1  ORF type:complete len:145 (+),score=5.08 TRINITY_DN4867_c0_g1_i1:32-466(+)